ncbi:MULTISPECIES: GLPGLI family protein [unclassified Spirosoma]|uniref:GLPGLI family protein n=1 Tax=unclassified Spirosoma TaxID=2621999 RepID=UPI0009636AAD|nr:MULTISPECIES: GLPGLI family protein [unclassified Spirosoma]MBN8823625.1 GLPGLI family protein [Spirosoma sp.]OJW76816.1 MAG: GLPGLI family protein [Spirosoma sp. 48-14]
MKSGIFTLLLTGLTTTAVLAQTTAPTSGKITYEGMRQIDRSQMRMVINGQEVRPGSPSGAPDAPEGLPETISFTQKLVFSGSMAKEERDRQQGPMMFRRQMGDGAPDGNGTPGGERPNRPRGDMRMNFPFEQQTYLDLTNKQRIDVLTVKKDSVTTTYRTDRPMPAATDWQTSEKTKKIAGYVCHKATATHRKMPYTIWYTTDLPFTYSPVSDLTPPQGVVLLIESDTESYKATGVSTESVAEASVQPPKEAKVVSAEEMEQIRRKGMADFRQRMMQNMPFQRSNN